MDPEVISESLIFEELDVEDAQEILEVARKSNYENIKTSLSTREHIS